MVLFWLFVGVHIVLFNGVLVDVFYCVVLVCCECSSCACCLVGWVCVCDFGVCLGVC